MQGFSLAPNERRRNSSRARDKAWNVAPPCRHSRLVYVTLLLKYTHTVSTPVRATGAGQCNVVRSWADINRAGCDDIVCDETP